MAYKASHLFGPRPPTVSLPSDSCPASEVLFSVINCFLVSMALVFALGHKDPELPVSALQTPNHVHKRVKVSHLDRKLNTWMLCSGIALVFLEGDTVRDL